MNVRGHRECHECGTRWSYFETGTVACPGCGSVRSLSVSEEPPRHTARQEELDLAAAQAAVDDRPPVAVARMAVEATRSILAVRGFIDAGTLHALDDVTLAAGELRGVADEVRRRRALEAPEERYFLSLLHGATDGSRPRPVPPALQPAMARGVATVLERYRLDLNRLLNDQPNPEARRLLGRYRDHLRRVDALEGDVPPETVDRLIAIARDIGNALRGDAAGLDRAAVRLSQLE